MVNNNNILGIIFSSSGPDAVRDLTEMRTLGSVPFGGKYRVIDFPLSSMVNCGINKVAVIPKNNYQSLMDHLGSGKAWDLSKRRNGLFLLPPFDSNSDYSTRVGALKAILGFLEHSKQEYVLLSDCDTICNIDFKDVLNEHIKNTADITIVYKKDRVPVGMQKLMVLSLASDGMISDISIDPNCADEYTYAFNVYLMRRDLLIRLIKECASRNASSFKRDFLQSNVKRLRMFGYNFTGYSHIITSKLEYFKANMEMMLPNVRKELFCADKPVYTKTRDDMPALYGPDAIAENSLIAHGCTIEGEVKNSVLFRGVRIGKGCKVENCVIMQDSDIGENCNLSYIIADKDITIKNGRSLMGFESYPIYISKASVI